MFTTTKTGVIRQFELFDWGGGLATDLVRSWNLGSITEGCVADDETGFVYLAEENGGIWKAGAEPGDPTPGTRVARVGDGSGLAADVEGLSIYYAADGNGYLLASSQGNSRFIVYDRAAPHAPVTQITVSGVSSTDGIDVTNVGLGPSFPYGIFGCHNDNGSPKPVEVCGFEDLGLDIDTVYWSPRRGVPTHAVARGTDVTNSGPRLTTGPNPVRKRTRLGFELSRPQVVSLRVVDGAGRHVSSLLDDHALPAGRHAPEWDGRDGAGRRAPPGVYFVWLETGEGRASTKAVLVR